LTLANSVLNNQKPLEMKTRKIITAILVFSLPVLISGCKNNQKEAGKNQEQTTQQTGQDLVKKGEYLVTFAGCNDCHSPKEDSPNGPQIVEALRLSGYPSTRTIMEGDPEVLKQGWVLFVPDLTSASGPWGVSFAANLTSDQTGIGEWPEENFIRALKQGKYKGVEGSRTLLPPMPWQNFANANDDDLLAIFAYLKSTKAVSNVVPAAVINQQPDNQVVTK
jgi:mono/diheme cytochrome c family protein